MERVGVLLRHRAVGGPARVPDPARPSGRPLAQLRHQVGQLADAATQLEAPPIVDRDSGRVITAILQAPQPADNHLGRLTRADISDDAAHICMLLTLLKQKTGNRRQETYLTTSRVSCLASLPECGKSLGDATRLPRAAKCVVVLTAPCLFAPVAGWFCWGACRRWRAWEASADLSIFHSTLERFNV